MHGETTKSTEKQVKCLDKELEYKHNLFTQVSPNPHADVEYMIAKTMVDFNFKGTTNEWPFGQQHILQKGLKLFKDKGHNATIEELDQLHRRMCFIPVDVSDLTRNGKKKAMEALMLMTEKKDKTVKG